MLEKFPSDFMHQLGGPAHLHWQVVTPFRARKLSPGTLDTAPPRHRKNIFHKPPPLRRLSLLPTRAKGSRSGLHIDINVIQSCPETGTGGSPAPDIRCEIHSGLTESQLAT